MPEVARMRNTCLAALLVLLNQSCYRPPYQLALYDGAERLSDGPSFEHQRSNSDCGVAAAVMMLRLSGRQVEYRALRQEVHPSRGGLSLAQIRDLMLKHELAANGMTLDPLALDRVPLPLIAWLPTRHVVVLEKVTSTSAVISDPGRGRWKVSRARLSHWWDGTALVPAPISARISLQGGPTP